jgi:hypothetical protein
MTQLLKMNLLPDLFPSTTANNPVNEILKYKRFTQIYLFVITANLQKSSHHTYSNFQKETDAPKHQTD